jgi:hypothetical protein
VASTVFTISLLEAEKVDVTFSASKFRMYADNEVGCLGVDYGVDAGLVVADRRCIIIRSGMSAARAGESIDAGG